MSRPTRVVRAAGLVAAALSLSGCASFAEAWEEGEARAEASASAAATEPADAGIVIERADGQPVEPSPLVLAFDPAIDWEDDLLYRGRGHADFIKQAWDGTYRWCFTLELDGRYESPTMHCEQMPKDWTPEHGFGKDAGPAKTAP